MKILRDLEQGSKPWLQARVGVLTASQAHRVVTPAQLKRAKTGYAVELAAEAIIGQPLDDDSYKGGWVDRGKELEPEARAWLAFERDIEIEEVGFVVSDCGRYGCSPDGICEPERVGIELKVPGLKKHVAYLLDPESLCKEYRMQVQFGLWVTGWEHWVLASYSPAPQVASLALDIERDPKVMDAFDEHVPAFLAEVDEAISRVRELSPVDESDPIGGWN